MAHIIDTFLMEGDRQLPALLTLSFLALLTGLVYFIDQDWLPVLVYIILLSSLPIILYQAGIRSFDPSFPPLLFLLAYLIKMLMSLARYWMVVDLYGRGDSIGYHRAGQKIFQQFQTQGFFIPDSATRLGTKYLGYLTGLLYTALPDNLLGSFLFFASLAFIGSVLYYGAYRLAFPEANPIFYRLMVFFTPSVLFWPASLGKDAWMFFCSGIVAHGLATYIRRRQFSGLIWVSLGLALLGIIRPHVAAFMIIGMGVTHLLFFQHVYTTQEFLAWLFGGVIVIALGVVILQSSQEFLQAWGLSDFTLDGVLAFIEERQTTIGGGSKFNNPFVIGAGAAVGAVLAPIYLAATVLLRPLPFEAGNPQALGTSVEMLVIWGALIWYRRHIFVGRIRSIMTDPWIAFVTVHSILMILSFSTIANFGILARQRVMFLPFIWMLFA